MHRNITIPGFIWYVGWRIALGVLIFHQGMERIDMLDRMHDLAMSRRPGGGWYQYFLLDRPAVLGAYLMPLAAWWIGGALITHERDGTVSLIGAVIFAVAALPVAGYYLFCAVTIAMGVGFVTALIAGLSSALGPLYLIEPLIFAGFLSGLVRALGT